MKRYLVTQRPRLVRRNHKNVRSVVAAAAVRKQITERPGRIRYRHQRIILRQYRRHRQSIRRTVVHQNHHQLGRLTRIKIAVAIPRSIVHNNRHKGNRRRVHRHRETARPGRVAANNVRAGHRQLELNNVIVRRVTCNRARERSRNVDDPEITRDRTVTLGAVGDRNIPIRRTQYRRHVVGRVRTDVLKLNVQANRLTTVRQPVIVARKIINGMFIVQHERALRGDDLDGRDIRDHIV